MLWALEQLGFHYSALLEARFRFLRFAMAATLQDDLTATRSLLNRMSGPKRAQVSKKQHDALQLKLGSTILSARDVPALLESIEVVGFEPDDERSLIEAVSAKFTDTPAAPEASCVRRCAKKQDFTGLPHFLSQGVCGRAWATIQTCSGIIASI